MDYMPLLEAVIVAAVAALFFREMVKLFDEDKNGA